MDPLYLLLLVTLAALLIVAGLMVMRRGDRWEPLIADLRRQLQAAEGELCSTRERLESVLLENAQFKQQQHQSEEARQRLGQEFEALAKQALSAQGEAIQSQNRVQIEGMLVPLREKIADFERVVRMTGTESSNERARLGEQIRLLSTNSEALSRQADGLARALRGDSRQQGAWGEMILATVLESSGLRKGLQYVMQESVTGEEGMLLRPDVIVQLPGDEKVVIDSKVSLTAFDRYLHAETDAGREANLKDHVRSLRSHIDRLADKDYAGAAGSRLRCVLMFIPIEGALAAAMQQDRGLAEYAMQRHVAIATPTTLMLILRTIREVWRSGELNRNAEQIARRAGILFDKFAGFVADLEKSGSSLDAAKAAHDRAMTKLKTGSGNLVGQARKLKELGAATSKSLEGDDLEDESEAAAHGARGGNEQDATPAGGIDRQIPLLQEITKFGDGLNAS